MKNLESSEITCGDHSMLDIIALGDIFFKFKIILNVFLNRQRGYNELWLQCFFHFGLHNQLLLKRISHIIFNI